MKKYYPRYFTNVKGFREPGLTYIRYDDPDSSFRVFNDGKEDYFGSDIGTALQYVEENMWKEITKDEAEKLLAEKFPKYYVQDKYNCWCDTAFVRLENKNATTIWVRFDGSEHAEDWWNYKMCKEYVINGNWKEITEDEAEKLLAPKLPEFPRYFIAGSAEWYNKDIAYVVYYSKNSSSVIFKNGDFIGPSAHPFDCAESLAKKGYWKEITSREALDIEILEKNSQKKPRYFTTNASPWDNNIIYVIIGENGSWDVDTFGNKTKSNDTLSNNEYFVGMDLRKEITKEQAEALIKKPFPRYFTENNWCRYIAYIVFQDEEKGDVVKRDGKTWKSFSTFKENEKMVERGIRKEVTEKEALALLDKNQPPKETKVTLSLTKEEVKDLSNVLNISVLSGWPLGRKIEKALNNA